SAAAAPQQSPSQPSSDRTAARPSLDTEEPVIDEEEAELASELSALRKKRLIDEIRRLQEEEGQPARQRARQSPPSSIPSAALGRGLPALIFKGQDWNEVQTFLFQLAGRFQIFGITDDLQRVLYASSCLQGIVHRRWVIYVGNQGGMEGITWGAMEDWLRASVSADEDTRAFQAIGRMLAMRQQPNQTYQQFIDRWEEVESECPDPLPERTRVVWVVHRLLPELQHSVMAAGVPKTRAELDGRARRAEVFRNPRASRPAEQPPS
ncbi:hypothetical protein CSUB01_12671, partial [Colletotrichum sublineola]